MSKAQMPSQEEYEFLRQSFYSANEDLLNELGKRFGEWTKKGDVASIHFMAQFLNAALQLCNERCKHHLHKMADEPGMYGYGSDTTQ